MDGEKIVFTDGQELNDIDVIIFATGYNLALPFCKIVDEPWSDTRILDGFIGADESGDEADKGGMRGLAVQGLDELMLFLDGDRSISFPTIRKLHPHNAANDRISNRPFHPRRDPSPTHSPALGESSPIFS